MSLGPDRASDLMVRSLDLKLDTAPRLCQTSLALWMRSTATFSRPDIRGRRGAGTALRGRQRNHDSKATEVLTLPTGLYFGEVLPHAAPAALPRPRLTGPLRGACSWQRTTNSIVHVGQERLDHPTGRNLIAAMRRTRRSLRTSATAALSVTLKPNGTNARSLAIRIPQDGLIAREVRPYAEPATNRSRRRNRGVCWIDSPTGSGSLRRWCAHDERFRN